MGGSIGLSGSSLVDIGGHTLLCDYVGGTNPIYIGITVAGHATSEPTWQIRKVAYDGNNNITSILYSNGSQAFNAIWDNRVGLSYS